MSDYGGYFTFIIRQFSRFQQMSDYTAYSIIRHFFRFPMSVRLRKFHCIFIIDVVDDLQGVHQYLMHQNMSSSNFSLNLS